MCNFAVMISLVQHIEYLMMEHDCVVVPGWGALIAQYSESFYNSISHRVEKPQRKVAFNAAVNHNDGLLAQSLVRREGMTYDESLRFIADSVTSFRQQLAQGNELSFGRLGFFHAERKGKLEFVSFNQKSANDEFFGLQSVKFQTLAEMEAEQHEQRIPATENTFPWTSREWQWKRVARIAASIVMLLALTVLLTTPIIVDRQHTNYASLNLPTVKTPSIMPTAHSSNLDASLPNVDFDKTHTLPAMIDRTGYESGQYFLIIATLNSERQVKKFMEAHPDLEGRMHVTPLGKKYRVYVARSDSKESLNAIRNALPECYNDAWIGN